jgi:26S proteasome regulatory subunit N3
MSGDKPRANGNADQDDVEMNDSTTPTKNGKGKDGDEEMTVVVPPLKNGKATDPAAKDGEKTEEATPVDPREKAILGMSSSSWCISHTNVGRNQSKLRLA